MAQLPFRDELVASNTPVYFGDTVPTSGDFNLGDLFIVTVTSNATPGAMYPLMYRCTTASASHNGGSWTPLGAPTGYSSSVLASAASIVPIARVSKVSGTTTINSIAVPAGMVAGMSITLIPTGAWATTISGNIGLASTAVSGKALIMTWDGSTFYPSY